MGKRQEEGSDLEPLCLMPKPLWTNSLDTLSTYWEPSSAPANRGGSWAPASDYILGAVSGICLCERLLSFVAPGFQVTLTESQAQFWLEVSQCFDIVKARGGREITVGGGEGVIGRMGRWTQLP